MNIRARDRLATMLVESRQRLGLSQRPFAEKLGVSLYALQCWEAAKNAPTVEHLKSIARVLGYTLEELDTHLEGGDQPVGAIERSWSDKTDQILKMINSLPLDDVALIGHAATHRLATSAIK